MLKVQYGSSFYTWTRTHADSGGYRKLPKPGRAYAPTRSSKAHPRAPPPDPRLKPGPVFVASGGVNILFAVLFIDGLAVVLIGIDAK